MKTINDGVAIHDAGFQFFLLLNVKQEINKLIKELIEIEDCIKYHNETKEDKENSWYNSKTKLRCWGKVKEYPKNSNFTFREINIIYKETKNKYEFLIGIADRSLNEIKETGTKNWKPAHGDENRGDIFIDHVDLDDFN